MKFYITKDKYNGFYLYERTINVEKQESCGETCNGDYLFWLLPNKVKNMKVGEVKEIEIEVRMLENN